MTRGASGQRRGAPGSRPLRIPWAALLVSCSACTVGPLPDMTGKICARKELCPAPLVCVLQGPDEGRCAMSAVLRVGDQPYEGYEGGSDAALFEDEPTKVFGAKSVIDIDGDTPDKSGKDSVGVFRWDLSPVLATSGVRVQKVRVLLEASNGSKFAFQAQAVRRPWSEATVTWEVASEGVPWELPGARGPTDRAEELLGLLNATTPGPASFELNEAGVREVQRWLEDPAQNFGFVLHSPEFDGMELVSREGATVAQRPALELTFAE